jgi:sortase (surface protein transpeptidase)
MAKKKSVKSATEDESLATTEKHRRKIRPVPTIVALLIVTIGIVQLLPRLVLQVSTAPAPNSQEVISEDVQTPDERKPNSDAPYNVPNDHPKRIEISAIQASGFIQKIGLNQQNAVSVPNNIHYAGWFVDSVLPGEIGLSIIDGHVSGRYRDGIFKNLYKLSPGDNFDIVFGDGSKKSFSVVEVSTKPEAEAAQKLFHKEPSIERQLNLITCGGTFNTQSQTYSDRVIVIASAIN